MTTTGYKYQISDRVGEAIIVIGSDTGDEAYASIPVLHDLKAQYAQAPLEQAQANVQTVFPAAAPVAPVAPPAPTWGPPAQQAAQPAPAAAASNPTCSHGVRIFKEGTSKAGKPYQMWKCPSTDRNNECDPVWIR